MTALRKPQCQNVVCFINFSLSFTQFLGLFAYSRFKNNKEKSFMDRLFYSPGCLFLQRKSRLTLTVLAVVSSFFDWNMKLSVDRTPGIGGLGFSQWLKLRWSSDTNTAVACSSASVTATLLSCSGQTLQGTFFMCRKRISNRPFQRDFRPWLVLK